MLIRCTFFRGRVKAGQQAAFDRAVTEYLIPLQVRFPGAENVCVLRQNESDTENPRFEMILALRYPSKEAIETALASDVRARSRKLTGEILELFDGDIFHTIFDAENFPMFAAGGRESLSA